MKSCNTCGAEKPEEAFPKNKGSKNGRESRCKECRAIYKQNLDRSYLGKLKKIYGKQKTSAKNRGQLPPDYTLDEFIAWAEKTDYPLIHRNWVKAEFSTDLSPSFDRIDESKSYTLANLKITTWKRNALRQQREVFAGKQTAKTRPVTQLDLEGNEVNKFPSISFAARKIGVTQQALGFAVRNPGKTCKGFLWEAQ